MLSDRELLELAAKAAGYRVHGWINERLYVVNQSDPAENFDPFQWNPLTDDGDALRLAVKLGITFRHFGHKVSAVGTTQCDEYVVGDPCEATRRAIVRAAAGTRRAA